MLLESLRHRENLLGLDEEGEPPSPPSDIQDWLTNIHLTQYIQNFKVKFPFGEKIKLLASLFRNSNLLLKGQNFEKPVWLETKMSFRRPF